MRLLIAALAVVATPLVASADPDPGACATTVNSKGVETTVCDPLGGSQAEPACWANDPGYALRPLPYTRVCVAL